MQSIDSISGEKSNYGPQPPLAIRGVTKVEMVIPIIMIWAISFFMMSSC